MLRLSVVRAAEHTEVCLCNLSDSGSDTGKQCWGGGSVVWIVFLQIFVEALPSGVMVFGADVVR